MVGGERNCHSSWFVFQNEISAMLEPLKKQLRKLNKTKEQWEETRTYIQVFTESHPENNPHVCLFICLFPVQRSSSDSVG